MLGPIFMRELVTVPRRAGHYAARAALLGLLGILGVTAWQATVGFTRDATLGETARFGLLLFQIVAFVQLLLLIFFAALSAASAVSQEKDRRTFVLLLLTDMRDYEIVLGKLLGACCRSRSCSSSASRSWRCCCCSAASTRSRWCRRRLVLAGDGGRGRVARRAGRPVARADVPGAGPVGAVPRPVPVPDAGGRGGRAAVSRRRRTGRRCRRGSTRSLAMQTVLDPPAGRVGRARRRPTGSRWSCSAGASCSTASASGSCGSGTRAASRSCSGRAPADGPRGELTPEELKKFRAKAHAAPGTVRQVWANPILWREIRTLAYGRRPLLVKLAFGVVLALILYFAVERR